MNKLVLNAQLYDLDLHQRRLLQEYYRLMISSLAASEGEIERLSTIWTEAEDDLVLCKWLSLIDYFYTNVPFSYESDDDDRRAYLSEYLELLVNEKQKNVNPDPSTLSDEAAICVKLQQGYCTLICPDGSGYILKPIEEMNSTNSANSAEWENQQCQHCKRELRHHTISCTETPYVN